MEKLKKTKARHPKNDVTKGFSKKVNLKNTQSVH